MRGCVTPRHTGCFCGGPSEYANRMAGPSPPDERHENHDTPMKTRTFASKPSRMDADAYAGFLKLWLTPASKVPAITPEIEAYLRHANEREPLNETSRDALCQPTRQAA